VLREEIITCRIAPNEAISENRICGMFACLPLAGAHRAYAAGGGRADRHFPAAGQFRCADPMKQVQESQFARTALEIALGRSGREGDGRRITRAKLMPILDDQKPPRRRSGDAWEFYLDNERFHQTHRGRRS
jgi:hypothetical protein